jgi:hypothetical protein
MSKHPFNPDELAALLDEMIESGVTTVPADSDPLIETALRLKNAPKPAINPTALTRIRLQLENAPPSPPVSSATPGFVMPTLVIVVVAIVIAIVVIVSSGGESEVIAPTETAPTTATMNETSTATVTITPSVTDVPLVEATEDLTPSETETPTPTQMATETATQSPTSVTIEGAVQNINGDVIVIFDIPIHVDPDDPLIDAIQIGDVIRIEGEIEGEGGDIVIIAVQITFTEIEVFAYQQSGEVWRDNGNCNNPPPPWAPANGWRRRCESPGSQGGGNPGRGGSGGSK